MGLVEHKVELSQKLLGRLAARGGRHAARRPRRDTVGFGVCAPVARQAAMASRSALFFLSTSTYPAPERTRRPHHTTRGAPSRAGVGDALAFYE